MSHTTYNPNSNSIIKHDNIDTVQTDKTRLYEAEHNSSSKFNPFKFICSYLPNLPN